MKKLPRNIYKHKTGYRGVRMVKGKRLRTRVYRTPEQAEAALELLVEGEAEHVGPATPLPDLLRNVIDSSEQTSRQARRALMRLETEDDQQ